MNRQEFRHGGRRAAARSTSSAPGAGSSPAEARLQHVSDALAPFVAWLATQGLEEDARRRHRDAAERFLVWCLNDGGPVRGRRGRWLRHVRRHDPDHLDDAAAGLGWWTDHRRLLAQTLPYDG